MLNDNTLPGFTVDKTDYQFDFSSSPQWLSGNTITGTPAITISPSFGQEGFTPNYANVTVSGAIVTLQIDLRGATQGITYDVACVPTWTPSEALEGWIGQLIVGGTQV